MNPLSSSSSALSSSAPSPSWGDRHFARLLDLPISQDLSDRWHTIAMAHLLIHQSTRSAAVEPPLSCATLYSMLEGTALFSMKFGQCPVPVDLLAVKSNTFAPPCPPDLGRNTLAQQLHFSLLDWQMTAADELDHLRTSIISNNIDDEQKIINDEGGATAANTSSLASLELTEKFLKEAEAELTKLIEHPKNYQFRNSENVSTKLAMPSFGVEGFASAVFWLCVVRQAKAESRQNAEINRGSPIQHHKQHRYDAAVGDSIWRQALIDVLNPTSGFLEPKRKSSSKNNNNNKNKTKTNDQDDNDASNLGDVLMLQRHDNSLKKKNNDEKGCNNNNIDGDRDHADETRQSVVSVSKIINRVGGHVEPDAASLFKLLLSFSSSELKAEHEQMAAAKKKKNDAEKSQKRRQSLIASSLDDDAQDLTSSLSDFWETKLTELKMMAMKKDHHHHHQNNNNNNNNNSDIDDTISLEDAMHLLCVKRVSDLDDDLIEDLEKWCLRRVSLWIMQRFSPLHFPSSQKADEGGGGHFSNQCYRPYLLRCFFKIVSTAVARMMTRLFNGTVTGTEVSQHDMWITVRARSAASAVLGGSGGGDDEDDKDDDGDSDQQNSNKNKNLHHQSKHRRAAHLMNIPPEVMHAKMLQANVEKLLLEIASLPPMMAGAKCIFSGGSNSIHHHHHQSPHKKYRQQQSQSQSQQQRPATASSLLINNNKSGASFRSARIIKNNNQVLEEEETTITKKSSKKEDQQNIGTIEASEVSSSVSGCEIPPLVISQQQQQQQQPTTNNNNNNNDVLMLKHHLQENIRQALHDRKVLGKKPPLILTDDVTAIRRDAAQRAAARKRSVALIEGEYTNNNNEDDQNENVGEDSTANEKNVVRQQQQQRSSTTKYVGWNLADKGIAIGDDSDYRKNLTTPSAINRMMLSIVIDDDGDSIKKNKKRGDDENRDDEDFYDDYDDEHSHHHHQEESAREIMASVRQRVGASSSSASTSAVHEEQKNLQARALASRQSMRDVIDADRRALASHFGDLKTVVSEMDKLRMAQLLRLQGANGHPTSSTMMHRHHQQQQKQQQEENNNNSNNIIASNDRTMMKENKLRKKSLLEIQLEAKAAAAAKVKEMQSNRPHSARLFSSSSASSSSSSPNFIAFKGLSQGAKSMLRDPEEIVGHIAPIRPKERVLNLTPRSSGAAAQSNNDLARKTIRADLQSCLQRVAVANQLTEDEENEQTAQSIMKHFKRNLADQSQADLARSVSVFADRVRAESARKKTERTYERHHFISELKREVAALNISAGEIAKRCTTGIRTIEYYTALHTCKVKIDTELEQKGFEYLIKERNVLRDLAMVVHRLMALVRRNYSDHVDEFEEFELRRKGRKNFAVKRDAEYL